MKQKTPIAELIEWIEEFTPKNKNTTAIWSKAKSLLPKEKEIIIDFGNKMQCVTDIDFDGNITFTFNPNESFNENFEK